MALPATESFTGTNGARVNSLTNWDGCRSDSPGSGLAIQSNAAQPDASFQLGDWWTTDAFSNDQYSKGVIAALASGVYVGVGVRMGGTDGGSNLSGYIFTSDSADGCYLEKYTAGTWQGVLATGSVFSNGDTVEIRISGNAITCLVNTVSRLTYTDNSSPISSGAAGITGYGNGASRIDSWEGGNVSAAAASFPPLVRSRLYRRR